MVLGIREYPVNIDPDELIEFIDTSIAEESTKTWLMYLNLPFMMVKMIS